MTIIIAEIGLNHNGSVETAKQLVDESLEAGADYAKFQMRDLQSLYRDPDDYAREDLGVQYVLDLLNKFELSVDEMHYLFDYCKEQGIRPLCTPWDLATVDLLEEYGIEAYKTASADFTNHPLLGRLIQTKKPLFCSTGMSSEEEIIESCELLKSHNTPFTLLHCNSTYPTPFKDVNLQYIVRLREISGRPVGYSGHERGIEVPIAAVALGAVVIEKHITLCREWEGNDHKVSLLPEEFKDMVSAIRNVELALGTADARVITTGERINRDNLAKSIVAASDLPKGTVLTLDNLDIKSPGGGLQPNNLGTLVGKTIQSDRKQGDFIYWADIEASFRNHEFKFKHAWGVPVRPHDWEHYRDWGIDLLEFHISYNDLKLDPADYLEQLDCDFTLHSPDLFEGDHLIDLGSDNQFHRQISVENLARVVGLAKQMRPYFKCKGKTKIIASVGGVSRNDFIDGKLKQARYDWVAGHLAELTDEDTEFIIQTVPPMPWYFGGQLYLNLFVDCHEIKRFCEQTGQRICFDVSHSMMASQYFGYDFYEFAEIVAPFTAHLHLSDARSVDEEGLQIGAGLIDFARLAKTFEDSRASFIPEVWQGHHDRGRECWRALELLEPAGW